MPKNPAQAHLDQKLLGRIPLVVGITGHRDLRPGDRAALMAQVDAVFGELKTRYLKREPETPIILLSSLAEGADQLVAEVALQHHAILIAPLPMEKDEYLADFVDPRRRIDPDAEAKFRAMLHRAFAYIELPYHGQNTRALVASNEDKRAEQYQDVGIFIVRNCHVLIALYNGEDTGLAGGTAEIVKFKREGIPLRFSGSINAALDGSEVGPVIEIATPRAKPGSREVKIEQLAWGEKKSWAAWRVIKDFALFLRSAIGIVAQKHPKPDQRAWLVFRAIAEQTRRFNREAERVGRRRSEPTPAQSLSRLFENAKRVFKPDAQRDAVRSAPYWCELYKLADVAAQVRQTRFRLDWRVLFAAGFVALLAFEFFAHVWHDTHELLAAYVIIFVGVFAWFILARYREHQERFLDYRALAEALRVAVYWKLGGIAAPVSDAYPIKQPSELAWVKITLRAIDMLHLADPPQAIQMDARSLDLVRELWVDGQRSYFERQGDRHHRNAERGEARSLVFLALSPLVGAVLWIYFHRIAHSHHVHDGMIVAIGLAAGAAAVFAGYIEKLAYHAHARQYDRMRLLFEQALWLMPEVAPAANLPEIEELYRTLGSEAMKENADWVAIYRQRPIRPAG